MKTIAERLWEKVDKTGDCWLWTRSLTIGNRYGGLSVDGRMRPAHRVAYELTVGPIPDGLELDHLCRNTRCVRPAHLEPVTHRENMRRGQGWAGQNARKSTCARHGIALSQRRWGRICTECAKERNAAYRRRKGGVDIATARRATWASRTPAERAEISAKIWSTRRANASVR